MFNKYVKKEAVLKILRGWVDYNLKTLIEVRKAASNAESDYLKEEYVQKIKLLETRYDESKFLYAAMKAELL